MKCDIIKNLLAAYVDNELDADLKKEIDLHVKICAHCQEELYFLKRYKKTMNSLQQIKAPDDFLTNVHSRLDKPSWSKKIKQLLFSPLKVKLPFEAAALLAMIFLIINIFKSSDIVEQAAVHEEAKDEKSVVFLKKEKRIIHDKVAVIDKKSDSIPLMRKDFHSKTAADKGKESIQTKTYVIALLLKEDRYMESDKDMSRAPSMENNIDKIEEKSMKEVYQEKKEKKKRSVALSKKMGNSQEPGINKPLDTIKNIITSVNGNILTINYPENIIFEIPWDQYKIFYEKLNRLGTIKNIDTIPLKEKGFIKIKIQLTTEK